MADETLPYSGPIITRKEARAKGLPRYFPGSVCKNGHLAERNTANGSCLVCAAKARPAHRAKAADKIKAYQKAWWAKNPTYKADYAAKRYGRIVKKRPPAPHVVPVLMYSGPVVTLAEARAKGLSRFFSGVACINGHIDQRETINNVCVACEIERRTKPRFICDDPPDELPATQLEARALGLPYFFTGEPCKRGHVSLRRANSGRCPECSVASAKLWQQSHPERVKEWRREYRRRCPEKGIVHIHNRRARKLANGGTHTAEQYAEVLRKQKYRCIYCKADLRKVRHHRDHRVPLVKGGTNDISNIQATCGPCNQKKGKHDPVVFAQSLGLLLL